MKFLDLEPGDPRLEHEALPVLRQLRPHLTAELFREIYAEAHAQGMRFTAAYLDDGCAGVAGWRVIVSTNARKLYVDDLVTDERARSQGVGQALLAHLEERAKELGCLRLALDSGVQRHSAHRFYLRERMDITAHRFEKRLS